MYQHAKIYKLLCDDGHYYYGSSCNELRVRFQQHKEDSKKNPYQKVYSHINELGWDKVSIVLVEEYPCETKSQLRQREDWYIRPSITDALCLNQRKSHWNEEDEREYYKSGRDLERKKVTDKIGYERRKENLLSQYTCECGATLARCGRPRHERTQRHRTFLAT